jgi:hypothetical protein
VRSTSDSTRAEHHKWDAYWLLFTIAVEGVPSSNPKYHLAEWLENAVIKDGAEMKRIIALHAPAFRNSTVGVALEQMGIQPTLANYLRLRRACERSLEEERAQKREAALTKKV